MKLLIIRHGQTDWNSQKILQGQQDTELNATGRSEATQVAKKLLKLSIHQIIASPLKRAAQTAQIINEQLLLPIRYDSRLKERGFGYYEGKCFNQNDMNEFWNEKHEFIENNVESLQDLRFRIKELLDEIIPLDQTILLVTHGVISAMIAEYFSVEPIDDYPAFILKNCEIAEYNT